MNLDELFLLSQQYLELNNKTYLRTLTIPGFLQHRLSILTGQRGVGKTTLIVQFLLAAAKNDLRSRRILYVPSDHFLLGRHSLYEIAEQFHLLGGTLIAFDEIHKYAGWSKELKSIYDTFPRLNIIASGSSALEIHKGSHDLTRRAIVHAIPGLSFREYLALHLGKKFAAVRLEELVRHHETLARDTAQAVAITGHTILAEFKRYLQIGYYPYFLEMPSTETYFMTLEQNFHTTLETDIPAIYPALNGNSIRKIKQLLGFIAECVPFTLNLHKTKDLLDISDERTLKTYLKYLEDAELIRLLMKASTKLQKLSSPEKVYLHNPNQLHAISHAQQETGTLRELFFLSALSDLYTVTIPIKGDFLVDHQWLFEVGGKSKDFKQIQQEDNAYLACDDIEVGIRNKIPLWLLGFLY